MTLTLLKRLHDGGRAVNFWHPADSCDVAIHLPPCEELPYFPKGAGEGLLVV